MSQYCPLEPSSPRLPRQSKGLVPSAGICWPWHVYELRLHPFLLKGNTSFLHLTEVENHSLSFLSYSAFNILLSLQAWHLLGHGPTQASPQALPRFRGLEVGQTDRQTDRHGQRGALPALPLPRGGLSALMVCKALSLISELGNLQQPDKTLRRSEASRPPGGSRLPVCGAQGSPEAAPPARGLPSPGLERRDTLPGRAAGLSPLL